MTTRLVVYIYTHTNTIYIHIDTINIYIHKYIRTYILTFIDTLMILQVNTLTPVYFHLENLYI